MRSFTLALAGAALVFASAGAQAPPVRPAAKPVGPSQGKPAAPAKKWVMPRTLDGKPDLQGNWTNATITPLERAQGQPLVLTEEQAATLERRTQLALEAREQASDPNRPAPPVGGSLRPPSPGGPEPTYLDRLWQAGAGVVGGYNSFWIDPGDRVVRIDGGPRSSILIDPPDGRVPALTTEGRARVSAAADARRKLGSEFDHPELRPLGERCITSFGSNTGPPMLPNYFYNNNYTIVQGKDSVMIMSEMVHDARIIRIGGQHPPSSVRQWFGDSIGRWEGDTLVIETTNFHPLHGFRGSWENLKVTERLTRVDADTINYKFTIEDPTTFTAALTGELPFKAMAEQVYEYACHEANYGLEGVMSGARAQERDAAKKKSQQ
jgi:hypothetical protein